MPHKLPKKQVIVNPPQNWKVMRIPSSRRLAKAIPPYYHADGRLFSLGNTNIIPRYVLHARSNVTQSAFKDLVIARIAHQTQHPDIPDEDFISIMLSSRFGIAQHLKKQFEEAGLNPYRVASTPDQLLSHWGYTVSINNLNRSDRFFNFIHSKITLPPDVLSTYQQLTKPIWNEPTLFAENTEFKPAYYVQIEGVLNVGSYWATYQEHDQEIARELPEIHKVLLAQDNNALVDILRKSPSAANWKDPWGFTAHELAKQLGNPKAMYELVKARLSLSSLSPGERMLLQNDRTLFGIENAKLPFFFKPRTDFREKYAIHCQLPTPRRSSLHLACIHGDQKKVEELILSEPSRLNEQDPRGYTPALLAAANGHSELLRWLLQNGASLEDVEYQPPFGFKRTLRLIDNAIDMPTMKVLFEYRLDPHHYNNRLRMAILQNNIPLAECLLIYLQKLPEYRGLDMIEYALSLTKQYGSNMLKTLLLAYPDFVPSGPYDDNVPPEAAEAYTNHNIRIKARQDQHVNALQVTEADLERNKLITHFRSKQLHITEEIKPLSMLTGDELTTVKNIAMKEFDLQSESIKAQLSSYFDNELNERKNCPAYISLFKHNDAIVSFFVFELIDSYHEEKGYFKLFHAKLAKTVKEYKSLHLATLALRTMLAVQRHSVTPVFTYGEAIAPGFGFVILTPSGIDFSPKFAEFSISFIKHVVNLTGERLVGRTVPTKLKVRSPEIKQDNLSFKLFQQSGGNEANALPVVFEITPDTVNAFLNNLAHHGFDEDWLKLHTELLEQFLSPKQKSCVL